MRYKKTVVLIVALLMVFSMMNFAKTQNLRRVGVVPLMKGGVEGPDDLKPLIEKYSEEIKIGFDKAGASFLYSDFMDQVKSAAIREDVIPKGEHMQWMLFRKGKAVKDLQWAGKQALEVYMFVIQKDCKDYHFIVPRPCGNIALVKDTNTLATCDMQVSPAKVNIGDTITVDMSGSKCATKMEVKVYHPAGTLIDSKELTAGNAVWKTSFKEPGDYVIKGEAFNADGVVTKGDCEAKVYVNYPPVCDLKVDPADGYVGQVFKLDASGSSDKDGTVEKAEFTVTLDGAEVEKKEITTKPLVWNKKFVKSGIYKIALKVTDDFGAVSANTCELSVEVQKRFYALVEGGPMVAKGTYSGYLFGRLGFAYLLVPEKLSAVVSAGGAFSLAGAPFKTHFLSNLLLNAHFDSFFLGGGVGFSSKVRDDWKSDFDIVGNIGFDVFKAFNKKGSIFMELRYPVKKELEFSEAHEILLGFRLLF
ncbi:MAG: hypothetical protein GY950_33900 [bacterium]|nr:hypothetical protein [bacterium]